MPYEDCPEGCTHETFHHCEESGTHCNIHCVCDCPACEALREDPLSGTELAGSGERIVGRAFVVETGSAGNDFAALLSLVSALGRDGAQIVPPADAADARNGATRIPDRVTDARRTGRTVRFVQQGSVQNWYWEMPNGEIIYHG